MTKLLNKIRLPMYISRPKQFLYSILIMVLGMALGIIAKALDVTASNMLPHFLEILDLRNFLSRMGFWLFSGICIAIYCKSPLRAGLNTFLFFMGMVSSYYIYTIYVSGFFPKSYMMIWIGLTILSPFIGAVCWYAKGAHPLSICLSSVIFMMISRQVFAFGFWYLDVPYMLEFILWILTILVLYKNPKQILIVLSAGSLLYIMTAQLYLFGGLL